MEVSEIDEELNKLNGGTFPANAEYRKEVLVPTIKSDLFSRTSVLFFTTTRYFSLDEVAAARRNGFAIVQLVLDREEMSRRNKKRMEIEGYNDHTPWFDEMLNFQREIKKRGLVDAAIDANKPTSEIAEALLSFVNQRGSV